MPGPHGPRGPKPKLKNPGNLFARLMKFVLSKYAFPCIIVVICIFISVLANVQGTMFTQSLIDDYITPLVGQSEPDFSPLMQAILRLKPSKSQRVRFAFRSKKPVHL